MKKNKWWWLVLAPMAVLTAIVFVLFSGSFIGGLSIVVTVGMINCLLDWFDYRLTARVNADKPLTWIGYMNGIEIGRISDAQYANIKLNVLRDGRLPVAQLINMGRMALTIIQKVIVEVPLLFFWGAVATAIFSPESCADIVREFQRADPPAITLAARSLLQLLLPVMIIAFGAMIAMGYRFGHRNHYDEAINLMLRRHFKIPVDGDVQVYPWHFEKEFRPSPFPPIRDE